MEKLTKIAVLKNEFEAKLLSEILADREIPHLVRSYSDSAYDGLWQNQYGWGHIEAPELYKDEIMEIHQNIKEESSAFLDNSFDE